MDISKKNSVYMSGLGSSLGFSYLPEWNFRANSLQLPKWVIGDLATKPCGIFGTHAGYLIAMGVFQDSDGPDYLQIIVRHTPIAAPALRQLKNAIKAIPGFRSFVRHKSVQTTEDFVNIQWGLPNLWEKPRAEEVANMLDLILQEIRCYARPLDGKCEDCRAVAAPQIVFVDGIPGHHCAGCLKAVTAEYDAIKVDYPRAALLGTGIALVMSIVWGMIQRISGGSGNTENIIQMCALGSMVTSVAIFWGVFRSLGKKERRGLVLAVSLTLSSRLVACILSAGGFLVHGQPVAYGWLILGMASFLVALITIPVLYMVPWCKSRPAIILQPVTVGGQNLPVLPEKTGKPLNI
jgi:uncharacterized membrane protein